MIVLSLTAPNLIPKSFFKHIHAFLATREARINQLLISCVSTRMHTSELRAAAVGRYVRGDAYAEHEHIEPGHTESKSARESVNMCPLAASQLSSSAHAFIRCLWVASATQRRSPVMVPVLPEPAHASGSMAQHAPSKLSLIHI